MDILSAIRNRKRGDGDHVMMPSCDRQLGEETVSLFRPFTKESLIRIEEGRKYRIGEARKAEQTHLKAEEDNGLDEVPKHKSVPHHENRMKPDPSLEDGMPLPRAFASSLPPEYIATPIEDLDKYYENERTFVIISKGKDVFRFSATNSMFILSPFNSVRRSAIRILLSRAFNIFINAAILLNFLLMTMPRNESIEKSEKVFICIYTVELCIKVIARGFILEKFTYLRDPWNWLDFIVNGIVYVTMGINGGDSGALRTFRMFRILKIAALISGIKRIEEAIMESVKKLKDVIIFILLSLSVFAIFSLQIYMGILTQKCIKDPDPDLRLSWEQFVSNYSASRDNWYLEKGNFVLCGNSSGARQCPNGTKCIQGIYPNPYYGYTTFDSFPWALLCAFQLMTQDYWESLYYMVLNTAGPWHTCFFVIIILWSFYLIDLIIAILFVSFNELQIKAYKQEEEAEEAAALQAEADGTKTEYLLASPDSDECMSPISDIPVRDPLSQTVLELKDLNVANDIEQADRPKSNEKDTGRDEVEKPSFKERCMANCGKCTDIFCIWDCCTCWVRFQEILSLIICDPFVDLFIALCTVMSIIFMAMDHHNMTVEMEGLLRRGYYFFNAALAIEVVLKIIALSPKRYFRENWNRLDFIIVALFLVEYGLEGVQGLSILRLSRMLWFFKLGKYWPTLNLQIAIMFRTMNPAVYLMTVLSIIVFVYAVIGMHLFGTNYYQYKERFPNGEVPYWNFTDFLHSAMVVFRVLCGEWIETMWDCLLVNGWTCIPFFISIVMIGNLVILNLFLALVLPRYLGCSIMHEVLDEYHYNIKGAIDRFYRAGKFMKRVFLQISKPFRAKHSSKTEDHSSDMREGLGEVTTTGEFVDGGSQVADKDTDKINAATDEIIISKNPADCFPDCCYIKFPFCLGKENSVFWMRWNKMRIKCFILVEHKYFEIVVLTMILISSLAMTLEDVHLDERPWLKEGLQYMNIVFAIFFLFEMLVAWLAFGFKVYFRMAWKWLDFVVVLVLVIDIIASFLGVANIQAFKTIHTLRALGPLRALSRVHGIRMMTNAFCQTIPYLYSCLLVGLIYWLMFAIIGVQLFAGKFSSCQKGGVRVNVSFVPHRMSCYENNLTWATPKINFDDVPNAFVALMQVATCKGWIDIMKSAIDARQIEDQPEDESNIYMYLYFVLFIIGSFYTFKLYVFTFIENFRNKRRMAKVSSLEMFMTEDQKEYIYAKKKMSSIKPAKAIPGPQSKLQAIVLDLTKSKKFEIVIKIFLFLNMAVMALDYFNSTELYDTILKSLGIFIIAIFAAECVLKIFALHMYYFKESWNIFNFVVVTVCILGFALEDSMAKYFNWTTFLRVVYIVRLGLVLRLAKGISRIRPFLYNLTVSLPSLLNISLLFLIIMFTYALFGMSLFMNVKHRGVVDQNFNFETFGRSMIFVFQMSTSAGWDAVLTPIMEEDDCKASSELEGDEVSDCGSTNIAIAYLVSYLIICFLIILNMYIAVILENYSKAVEDDHENLTDDVYNMYYKIWQNFDPDGTQFIRYSDLSTFLDTLEEPLRIPKPNKYKIISMDIPICEGDLVFCVDILDALVKDFFQREGRYIEENFALENEVSKDIKPGYKPIGSTLRRQREVYCSRIIQLGWRRCKGRLGHGEPRKIQTAIAVESDGHTTKNGH